MKYLLALLFVGAMCPTLSAQTVVSSSGDSYQSDHASLVFTLGEPCVLQFSSASAQVLEGFHRVFVKDRICEFDLNQDQLVNSGDLIIFVSEFNCNSLCNYDFNIDGAVNTGDLILFLSAYGAGC